MEDKLYTMSNTPKKGSTVIEQGFFRKFCIFDSLTGLPTPIPSVIPPKIDNSNINEITPIIDTLMKNIKRQNFHRFF